MYMAKDKELWEVLGISQERWKEITLEIEHLQVDYRLSGMDEVQYIKKLFPEMDAEDIAKVIYFGRVQFWAGHGVRDP